MSAGHSFGTVIVKSIVMTVEELEGFNNSHLLKLAAEKFHKMAELEDKGASSEEIHPYLTDVKYILAVLREKGLA